MAPLPRSGSLADVVAPALNKKDEMESKLSTAASSPKGPPNPVAFINIPFLEFAGTLLVMALATYVLHQAGAFESYYWLAIYIVCQIAEGLSPATLNLVQYIYPVALVSYYTSNGFYPTWTQGFAFMPTVLFLIGVPMSVCLHRYFSHAAFTTTRAGQFAVAIVSTFAYQGGCLWWAAKHVRHHHHCDQPKDPHSVVQQGYMYAFCGWTMNPINLKDRDEQFLDKRLLVPELFFLDKCYLIPVALTFTYLEHVGCERSFIAYSLLLPMLVCRLITLLFNVEYHPVSDTKRCKSVDNPRLLALIVGESEHDLHHKSPAKSRRNDWDLACKCSYLQNTRNPMIRRCISLLHSSFMQIGSALAGWNSWDWFGISGRWFVY